MFIKMKGGVVYEPFSSKVELQEKILSMIMECKCNKIIYKGDPRTLEYKLMKKVMLSNYTAKIDPEIIKNKYNDMVESCEGKNYCIIYKTKDC
jgi:hypothetical protein